MLSLSAEPPGKPKNIGVHRLPLLQGIFPTQESNRGLLQLQACHTGDPGSAARLGRPPGEGKDYLVQYSGLENSRDCMVHGVSKCQTRLSNFHFHLYIIYDFVFLFIALLRKLILQLHLRHPLSITADPIQQKQKIIYQKLKQLCYVDKETQWNGGGSYLANKWQKSLRTRIC